MIEQHAAVTPTSHMHATLPATCLPGHREPAETGAYLPPASDLVVVKRPLSVEALLPNQQPGPALQKSPVPRKLMERYKWPSDHVPVLAEVATATGETLVVATWNCSDPC